MMPRNLIIVRHGQSEGNIAFKQSEKNGDNSAFTAEFRARHNSRWRLSDIGISQAIAAKMWLKEQGLVDFERKYVSEYLRAIETAIHLDLPGRPWFVDFYLRERDWGAMDSMPDDERRSVFSHDMRRRDIDSFYWTPPRGESMASLCLRIDRVLGTLHRECSDKNVIIVCHGEVMWGFRVRLERMTQSRFLELDASKDPLDRIHNCQILHYSRLNPESGEQASHLNWLRSVCPWDLTKSTNDWQKIERPRFTTEQLKALVESTPRLVN